MNTSIKAGITALLLAVSTPVLAGDLSETFGPATDHNTAPGYGPPSSVIQDHWISPNGCTYGRAHAPGYAPTWHLVLNGSVMGMTDARAGCPLLLKTPGQ